MNMKVVAGLMTLIPFLILVIYSGYQWNQVRKQREGNKKKLANFDNLIAQALQEKRMEK